MSVEARARKNPLTELASENGENTHAENLARLEELFVDAAMELLRGLYGEKFYGLHTNEDRCYYAVSPQHTYGIEILETMGLGDVGPRYKATNKKYYCKFIRPEGEQRPIQFVDEMPDDDEKDLEKEYVEYSAIWDSVKDDPNMLERILVAEVGKMPERRERFSQHLSEDVQNSIADYVHERDIFGPDSETDTTEPAQIQEALIAKLDEFEAFRVLAESVLAEATRLHERFRLADIVLMRKKVKEARERFAEMEATYSDNVGGDGRLKRLKDSFFAQPDIKSTFADLERMLVFYDKLSDKLGALRTASSALQKEDSELREALATQTEEAAYEHDVTIFVQNTEDRMKIVVKERTEAIEARNNLKDALLEVLQCMNQYEMIRE